MKQMEVRMDSAKLTAQSDGTLKVSGYVNKTEKLSNILGASKRFVEKIAKGAFSRAIQTSKRDIDFLDGHDASKILASTKNQSLILREDDEGLFMEATITPTSWGKDTYTLIESGIYQNMSFGFRTIKDSWKKIESNLYERTIDELELFEVSVVKNPAYSQSSISARGIDVIQEVEVPTNIQAPKKNSEVKNKERNNMIKTEHRYAITNEDLQMEKRKEDYEAFESYVKENRNTPTMLQTTAEGQAAIPESVANLVVKQMENISPVFARARKFPSVHGTLKIAREDELFDAGFVGEGSEVLEGDLSLTEVKLEQKRYGAAIHLTTQLINDAATNIPEYVANLLARRVVRVAEKSILTGSTSEEFRGIIHDTEIYEKVIQGSLDNVDDSTLQDFLMDVYNSVHPDYHQGSSFIVNKSAFNRIAKMKDAAGHFYLQNGVVNGKVTRTLFGAEVIVTDSLPDTNPIVFGNIHQGYAIMIKRNQGIQLIQDTKTALKGTKMFLADVYADGVVYNPAALAKVTVSL